MQFLPPAHTLGPPVGERMAPGKQPRKGEADELGPYPGSGTGRSVTLSEIPALLWASVSSPVK